MPLVSVLAYGKPLAVGTGTQDVGTLDVSGGIRLRFDPSLFSSANGPQTYTLFTFSTLVKAPYATFAAAVLETDLTGTGYSNVSFTEYPNAITVSLS